MYVHIFVSPGRPPAIPRTSLLPYPLIPLLPDPAPISLSLSTLSLSSFSLFSLSSRLLGWLWFCLGCGLGWSWFGFGLAWLAGLASVFVRSFVRSRESGGAWLAGCASESSFARSPVRCRGEWWCLPCSACKSVSENFCLLQEAGRSVIAALLRPPCGRDARSQPSFSSSSSSSSSLLLGGGGGREWSQRTDAFK
ncbi:uncharacterized protein [Physcomitrium patens]|uniref:uncharacterized protein isoform X4 n=1 Tax=Physcomitrium patens TaxID=3218 RepID=UPI003CCCA7A2